MLSIFDRIKISAACNRGEREFMRKMANAEREQRRENRAAGKNKNNGKNKNTVFNTGNKSNKNNEPKSEEQIKAESQAPEESVGAEKITVNATVESSAEAAMNGNVRIDDPPQRSINFGAVHIDLDAMNGGKKTNPSGNVFQQQEVNKPNFNPACAAMQQNGFNPTVNPTAPQAVPNPVVVPNPMMQFNVNSMPGMNTYANHINQQNPANVPMVPVMQYKQPPVGFGHHKVDNPAKPKAPKPPKAEPDKVDIDGMPNPVDGMDIVNYPKFDARTHGIVEKKVSMETEHTTITNIYGESNKQLYGSYPYLKDIEDIAIECGYNICFKLAPTSLIECYVCSPDGNIIPNKGFTIDPGMIIDRREKIFPIITKFYEGIASYHLFARPDKDNNKKHINVDIIKELIVGGSNAVTARPMHDRDTIEVNKFVALITLPTRNTNEADRAKIRNRLKSMYKEGIFSEVLASYPGSRFRIAEHNKSSGNILLDTSGVPCNYGGQYIPNDRIQMKITNTGYKVLTGDNIIDIPNKSD